MATYQRPTGKANFVAPPAACTCHLHETIQEVIYLHVGYIAIPSQPKVQQNVKNRTRGNKGSQGVRHGKTHLPCYPATDSKDFPLRLPTYIYLKKKTCMWVDSWVMAPDLPANVYSLLTSSPTHPVSEVLQAVSMTPSLPPMACIQTCQTAVAPTMGNRSWHQGTLVEHRKNPANRRGSRVNGQHIPGETGSIYDSRSPMIHRTTPSF